MKKMKLLPSAVLVANLMLCAVFCQAQSVNPRVTLEYRTSDTSRFIFSDTSKRLGFYNPNLMLEIDTVNVTLLISDSRNTPLIIKGYSVRKKHNSNMDSNGDWNCWNCKDYMLHSYYLDNNKKPLSQTVIVWQSVSVK